MDLILPDPIPPAQPQHGSPKYPTARSKHKCKKYIEKKIDYFSVNNANLKKYSNLSIVLSLFYIYLFKKYKSGCVVTLDFGNNTGLYIDLVNSFSNIPKYNSISEQMLKCIKRGVNIIIIPLYILTGRATGHANVLIYRKATNVLEHFEPHGAYYGSLSNGNVFGRESDRELVTYETTSFWRNLNMHLKEANIHEVELVESFKVCPHMEGFQSLEGTIPDKQETVGGYCTAWSMFFTELALANPALSSKEIVEIVFKKGGKLLGGQYMKDIIEGYSNHISDKLEKYYSILFNQPMTTVDIQCRWDNATPEEKYKIITEFYYIRNLEMEIIAGKRTIPQKIEYLRDQMKKKYNQQPHHRKEISKKLDILEKMEQLEGLKTPDSSFEPSPGPTPPPSPPTPSPPKPKTKSATKKSVPKVVTKICPEGQYLNPVTNRCNKIKVPTRKREPSTRKKKENDDGTEKLIDY